MDARSRPWLLPLVLSTAALPVAAGAEADNDIEQVVITATPLRESLLETAQPVTVITGDDLVPLRALSLGETLAAQPGISASYFGPQASRPVIRGLGGERVQMYEDGGEALDVSALSGDHAVTVDPLIARQIEVIRGPATLLYGNGASGGLINVLTNRVPESLPGEPLTGALELRGNSALDERAGALRLEGNSGSWAWHADGYARETDDVSIPDYAQSRRLREQLEAEGEEIDERRGTLRNSSSKTVGGALGGSFISEQALIGFAVSRLESDYGLPMEHAHEHEHEESDEDAGEPHEEGETGVRIDMAQTRYDLKAEIMEPFRGILSTRLRATFNDYEHREIEAGGEVGTRFEQDGVDARLVFDHAPLAGWRGTFGVQVRDVDFAAFGEEAFVPPSRTRNVGYFIFEERPLGPVTLELGARLEQQRITPDGITASYDDSAFSASAGALWKPADGYTLSLNVTSTRRHPTATELFANGPHLAAARFEIGNPSLAREHATTVDLGLRKGAGRWRMALSAFHSDYSRYIHAMPTGLEKDGLPVVEYVQADATLSGFEAELHPPAIQTALGTLSTRLMADYVRGKLKDGGNLPQIPPLRFGGGLELVRDRFSAGVSVIYHDEQDRVAEHELPTDSYTMVGLDIAYRAPLGERTMLLFLRGENLLDEDARRHSSPLKDIAPLPGRAVIAGVRVEL